MKNLPLFLEAVTIVVKKIPAVKFLIVGDGIERDKLIAYGRDLGISERLIFLGYREDIINIFKTINILVVPSREGLSMSILEAQAMAKPVIAVDAGGNAEVIKDGINGILIPPDMPIAMAEGIIELLNDKEKSEKMGKAGQKIIYENFSTKKMVEKISNLYLEMMEKYV